MQPKKEGDKLNARLLKGKMAELGYTQGALAHAIGISPQSLSRKINQKRQFTVMEALAICDLLEIPSEQRVSIFLPTESQKCNISEVYRNE